MRTILVWFPMLVILHALFVWFAIYVLIWWPVTTLGFDPYIRSVGYIDATGVIITAMISGLVYLYRRYVRRHRPLLMHYHLPNTGFSTAVGQWIRDRHDRICTTVRFTP
jgi:hypothetical protein